MKDGHHETPWNVTRQDLYDELRRRANRNDPTVIGRIVDVEGSAYRRPGAMMLVGGDDESVGAITAGCLEGPVTDLATEVFETGHPIVTTFDLVDDEEWGLGLGCNGVIDILLEPLDGSCWGVALAELEARRSVAVLTVVSSDDPEVDAGDDAILGGDGSILGGDGSILGGDGSILGDDGAVTGSDSVDPTASTLPERVVDPLRERAASLRADGQAALVPVDAEGRTVTVFVHGLVPPPELLVFGNQNDVHPVGKLARQVGFRVTVASARGNRASAEQFPNAHAVRAVRAPDLAEVVDEPTRTYAVLMSHNLTDDALALESLLKETAIPYVGLMGPRERFAEIRNESAITEVTYSEAELARVSTPVGLDLGGGEPAQIALSIVSEVLAVHNDRDGGRLTDKNGPIHRRVD